MRKNRLGVGRIIFHHLQLHLLLLLALALSLLEHPLLETALPRRIGRAPLLKEMEQKQMLRAEKNKYYFTRYKAIFFIQKKTRPPRYTPHIWAKFQKRQKRKTTEKNGKRSYDPESTTRQGWNTTKFKGFLFLWAVNAGVMMTTPVSYSLFFFYQRTNWMRKEGEQKRNWEKNWAKKFDLKK